MTESAHPNPEEVLETLVTQAMQDMQHYFTLKERSDKDVREGRIASGVMATWAKIRQVRSARDSLSFSMLRELSPDAEEFKKYLAVAFPHLPAAKALAPPKKTPVR